MSFFAVLIALLIEQLKPLPRDNWVHHRRCAWVGWVGRNFDAGQPHHVWVVWCVSVLTPTLLVALVYWAIAATAWCWRLFFDVAVLYVTLGFRQFSHYFTDMREALDNGDDDEVRRLLAEWLQLDASELPHTEMLRHVVEHALLAAHRHVFGVFFWFIVCSAAGPGPGRCRAVPNGRVRQPLLGLPSARARRAGPDRPLAGCRAHVFGRDRPGCRRA